VVEPGRLDVLEIRLDNVEDVLLRTEQLGHRVDSLRSDVRGLTLMWGQIHKNEDVLRETRREVAGKADARALRRLRWFSWVGVGVVSVVMALTVAATFQARATLHQVQLIAYQECLAANGRIRSTIEREASLAATDLPDTRAAHARSAAALRAQLRTCR
jgi:hypothetical protein